MSALAGRFADRIGLRPVQSFACVLAAAGWLPLLIGDRSVILAVLATVIIDVGVWSNQVVNQATIFQDATVPRGLANTYYFCARFLGISVGSAIGSTLFLAGHWPTAVAVAIAATGTGLASYLAWTPKKKSQRLAKSSAD